jgi:hypothetical protein
MNNDTTLINKLWWLKGFLNAHFGDKEYKEVYKKDLTPEICKEIDEIVLHIKQNY